MPPSKPREGETNGPPSVKIAVESCPRSASTSRNRKEKQPAQAHPIESRRRGPGEYDVAVQKKRAAAILKRLANVRRLSEDEKLLFARSLAATPDERWQLHENFLRSHGLYGRSERRKYGFKS